MLTDGDKTCLDEEIGWYLLIEAVVFDQVQIIGEEKYGSAQNYTAYFFGEIPRMVKLRVKLNDKDFTHEWQLLGTVSVPVGIETFIYRQAGYTGGAPINVFFSGGKRILESQPHRARGASN